MLAIRLPYSSNLNFFPLLSYGAYLFSFETWLRTFHTHSSFPQPAYQGISYIQTYRFLTFQYAFFHPILRLEDVEYSYDSICMILGTSYWFISVGLQCVGIDTC